MGGKKNILKKNIKQDSEAGGLDENKLHPVNLMVHSQYSPPFDTFYPQMQMKKKKKNY